MKSVKIFKTNIQDKDEADKVFGALTVIFPNSKIDFNLEDSNKLLTVEDSSAESNMVISIVENLGFLCEKISGETCQFEADSVEDMEGFWEDSFIEHQTMWGFEPSNSAVLTKDLFIENDIKDILIPGIGYGRNAKVFIENGMKVTGIEISQTAIHLAGKYYNDDLHIFYGSVTDMPFDTHLYDGIFCYGLVYLLNSAQRKKMIQDSFDQLKPGGWMVFSVVSKNSPNYGKGKEVREDTFEIGKGGQIFFYDADAVKREFREYGLVDFFEIDEQTNAETKKPAFKFIIIKCRKENTADEIENKCRTVDTSVIFKKLYQLF